jgi:hypothetical protein
MRKVSVRVSVTIGAKWAVPSAASSIGRTGPPSLSPIVSGTEAVAPGASTTRIESIRRAAVQCRVSAGRRSAGSATHAVVGSLSTAAAAPARGSATSELDAVTTGPPGRAVVAISRSSAAPGRGLAEMPIEYVAGSSTVKIRSRPVGSSAAWARAGLQRAQPTESRTQPPAAGFAVSKL